MEEHDNINTANISNNTNNITDTKTFSSSLITINALDTTSDLQDVPNNYAFSPRNFIEPNLIVKNSNLPLDETTLLQSELFLGKEDSMQVIYADLPRTFPELMFFHKEGPLYESLRSLLEMYACYRPDIGYCQGMSFIAAMFVLNMDSLYDAFVAFANLLNKQFLFTFFRFDYKLMSKHMGAFKIILNDQLPEISKHFDKIEMDCSIFLYDWFLTLFTRVLPLDVASRVWDNYFYQMSLSDEDKTHTMCALFLFKVALGILKVSSNTLLSRNMEDGLKYLRRLPENMNQEDFFKAIFDFEMDEKEFKNLIKF